MSARSETILALVFLGGLAAITTGAAIIDPAAGFIVGGVAACSAAVLVWRGSR